MSAPSALALAALLYLAAHGARTPLLALRGLLRVRNLAIIVVPAVGLGALALALQGRVEPGVSMGAVALAISPAPLLATGVVGRMRGRADQAGALVLGTIVASLLIAGSRGAVTAGALFTATEAFAITAMFANALPTLRDAALPLLRIAGWVGAVLVLAIAALQSPVVDATTVIVAAALVIVGVGAAAILARAVGRDVRAAVGGSGLRDPVLATALAMIVSGGDATGVPLVYAVFCLVLAGIALRSR